MRAPRFLYSTLLSILLPSAVHASVFVSKPCAPPAKSAAVRCGTISVPENPANPNGRMVALNVVVIRAKHKQPGVSPLFQLDGGPGIAATNASEFYLGPGSAYRQTRDVVLFDQRGTGRSNPLRCPALEHRHPLEDMYANDEVIACRDDLRSRADLSQYSTEVAATDIDRVRQTLGYPQIDLWAVSYGTRLAQAYMKRFPKRVHSAVLVGLVPLDHRTPLDHAINAQRVIDLILYECQRDDQCNGRYPNLRHEWQSLLESLERTPVTADSSTGRVAIRRGPFVEALRSFLYTAAGQRQFPFLVHAAASGDFGPFLEILPKDSSQFAEGLYLTIACSEGASRIRSADIARRTDGTASGDYRVRQELAACANWPVYSEPDDFYVPQKSSPPVLVLSGSMDPVAAPEWSSELCSNLPHCRLITIPDLGHGPFDLDQWKEGACFDDITVAFYRDAKSLDTSCLKRMRPPAFK